MTDEQILNSLNCCAYGNKGGCKQCDFHGDTAFCIPLLMRHAIDLINRQNAEIKGLHKENKILSVNADTAFQDGLNENRDLFKKEVEAEIKAEYVKLPVKIGDYLYTNTSHQGWYLRKRDAPYRVKVVFIGLNDSENMGGGFFNVVYQNEGMHAFYFSDIGKTVSLTREEAEKALKRCT